MLAAFDLGTTLRRHLIATGLAGATLPTFTDEITASNLNAFEAFLATIRAPDANRAARALNMLREKTHPESGYHDAALVLLAFLKEQIRINDTGTGTPVATPPGGSPGPSPT
jgi:hypothetical protein